MPPLPAQTPAKTSETIAAPAEQCDLAVVGGGILGLAVARELKGRHPELETVVLEAADRVGTGQTGRNSGVIHAGIYYVPGSLKARMCVAGARAMYELCERRGIAHERCGKLIVARDESELARLDELERRGRENAVPGLRRLGAEELKEVEPNCVGASALHSPNTGIVDFADVARALADDLADQGVPVVTGAGGANDERSRVRRNSDVLLGQVDPVRVRQEPGLERASWPSRPGPHRSPPWSAWRPWTTPASRSRRMS